MIVNRSVKGRGRQVVEAIMVAMSSAMCAFFLIYFDTSCQRKGKDPNKHPLQVNVLCLTCTIGLCSCVIRIDLQ